MPMSDSKPQSGSRTDDSVRTALEGLQGPTPLPGRRPQSQAQHLAHERSASHRRRLSAALSSQLLQLARSGGVTLNSLLQAAWALLLGRLAGSDDVVFGATVSVRPPALADIESPLGLFSNTLPVRVRLDPTHTAVSLAQTLQAQQLETRAFEGTPLVQAQRLSQLPPAQPLFDSLLVFQNAPLDPHGLAHGGGLEPQAAGAQELTHHPLTLVVALGQQLEILAEYDAAQFEHGAVERTLGCLEPLLAGIVERPGARLWELPLLTEAERHQVLVQWNDTRAEYPQDVCIHQFFEAQVDRTPEAVALVFEDRQLTYRELNDRANQLAHKLRALGIGPDVLVALCIERSLEMIIGLLGILKAGGAYVRPFALLRWRQRRYRVRPVPPLRPARARSGRRTAAARPAAARGVRARRAGLEA